jgi:hypothetical protein
MGVPRRIRQKRYVDATPEQGGGITPVLLKDRALDRDVLLLSDGQESVGELAR